MKKIIGFLCAMLMFFGIAGSTYSATLTMTVPTIYSKVSPSVTSEFYFTIETDDAGTVTAFTDFMCDYFYAASVGYVGGGTISFPVGDGGYDPRDGGVFTAGEQIYPNGVKQYTSSAFDGNTAGTALWFKSMAPLNGKMEGLVFNCGIVSITYDPIGEEGVVNFGPSSAIAMAYMFHACPIPIPGGLWLLGSGLLGLAVFSRKYKK